MNEFLISKGFALNSYEKDGEFYEWIHNKNIAKDNVIEVMEIFGFADNEGEVPDTLVLQCDRYLNNCRVCLEGNVWDIDFVQFIKKVDRIAK